MVRTFKHELHEEHFINSSMPPKRARPSTGSDSNMPLRPSIERSIEREHTVAPFGGTPILQEPRSTDVDDQLPTPNSTSSFDASFDTLQNLGVHSRVLIQKIQKLETLQIDATLPSLPKIVVVGDQSAGKSSIVEALCNVMLPRKAGTCTRVPFQITTSASLNAWECKVSLQRRFAYDPSYQSGLFERWHDQAPENFAFATVKHKQDLGPVLVRAQHALLSPREDPASFSNPQAQLEAPHVQFSPNLICLDITGPALPELSFYDLPGSINVVERQEDQFLVQFIEDLVKSYLGDEKALIMLACPADMEMENSTTLRFIRDCDAQNRCLGVLTKADLLPNARRDAVVKMLNGNAYQLFGGWFVTKQPTQDQLERGLAAVEARQLEQDFFAAGIWSHELAGHADRFGLSHLQDHLSLHLRQHILSNLDEIVSRVRERLCSLNAELNQFREKDAHPMMTVLNVLQAIDQSVTSHIKGNNDVVPFRPGYDNIKVELREELKRLAPELDAKTPGVKLKPVTPSSLQPGTAIRMGTPRVEVLVLDDDDDVDEPVDTPTRTSGHKRKHIDAPSSSAKKIKRETNFPMNAPRPTKLGLTITEVETIRNTHASSILPGQQSSVVTDIIINKSMNSWPVALDIILDRVHDQVINMLLKVTRSKLEPFKHCTLHDQALEIVNQYIEPLLDEQKDAAREILACERHKHLTVSKTEAYVTGAHEQLFKKRIQARANEYWDKASDNGEKTPKTEDKRKFAVCDALVKTLSTDPHKLTIEALVLPFAYYQMAIGRFVDCVFLKLEFKLLHAIETGLKKALEMGLGVAEVSTCEELLAEDAGLERRRQTLLGEKKRLEEAMAELNELHNS